MTIPLLLDTDIGDDVDDAFALLLAARQPAVELLGVTTVYGPVQERALIARKLLDTAGRSDVPVAVGEGITLAGRDPGRVLTSGHGYVDLTEWEQLAAALHPQPGVDFLIETVLSAPEPPVLVAIGPLTNVAAALRREPRLARRLQSLILMGGRLGEHADLGEHNFNSDAEATQVVIESGCPLWWRARAAQSDENRWCGSGLAIGTYEVTRQARIGETERATLHATGDAACMAVAAMLDLYLQERRRQATSMYDPATLTLGYTDEFVTLRRGRFTLTRAGDDLMQLHFDPQATPNGAASVAIRPAALVAHLLAVITPG